MGLISNLFSCDMSVMTRPQLYCHSLSFLCTHNSVFQTSSSFVKLPYPLLSDPFSLNFHPLLNYLFFVEFVPSASSTLLSHGLNLHIFQFCQWAAALSCWPPRTQMLSRMSCKKPQSMRNVTQCCMVQEEGGMCCICYKCT